MRDGARRGRARWTPLTVSLGWSIAVAVALISTLNSLESHDFDGLNNILQLPLSLPWFVLPVGRLMSHEGDAWMLAGFGWLNAVLIYQYVRRRVATRRQ